MLKWSNLTTIHTAKLQLISIVGLTKIATESKSELERLDSGNIFPDFTFIFTRTDAPKSPQNTHKPNCNKGLTTLNDTGTSQQEWQAWNAVEKAACQRNAEMLVRV